MNEKEYNKLIDTFDKNVQSGKYNPTSALQELVIQLFESGKSEEEVKLLFDRLLEHIFEGTSQIVAFHDMEDVFVEAKLMYLLSAKKSTSEKTSDELMDEASNSDE